MTRFFVIFNAVINFTYYIIMVTKLLVFILIMCILNIFKEAIRFGVCFYRNEQYESDLKRTALTWASISYILTILICGI